MEPGSIQPQKHTGAKLSTPRPCSHGCAHQYWTPSKHLCQANKTKCKPEGWTGAARGSGSQWSAVTNNSVKRTNSLVLIPAQDQMYLYLFSAARFIISSRMAHRPPALIFKSIPHSLPFRGWGRSEQLLSEQGKRHRNISEQQQQWSFGCQRHCWVWHPQLGPPEAHTCLPSCPTLVCPLTTVLMLSSSLLQEKPQSVKHSLCEPDPNNWGIILF